MSRSYHVTKKESAIAFSEGDHEPLFATSEKAWIKEQQRKTRAVTQVSGKARPNRAIVAAEKKRTAVTPSVIKYRGAVA